jgi:hypothetical protein
MDDFEFYEEDFNFFDEEDKEFLKQGTSTMVLQIYNNMGQVEDIKIGYESIKEFIDGIKE